MSFNYSHLQAGPMGLGAQAGGSGCVQAGMFSTAAPKAATIPPDLADLIRRARDSAALVKELQAASTRSLEALHAIERTISQTPPDNFETLGRLYQKRDVLYRRYKNECHRMDVAEFERMDRNNHAMSAFRRQLLDVE